MRRHDHKEAFTEMTYAANGETAGVSIRIWNSRDGVTPFVVSIDGREYTHVDWQNDRYLRWHRPKVGDSIFVSHTKESFLEVFRAVVEKHWDAPGSHPLSKHPNASGGKECVALTMAYREWQPDAPRLVEVDEEMAVKIAADHKVAQKSGLIAMRRF